MAHFVTPKVLQATATLVSVERAWVYNDGGADPYLGSPYRVVYNLAITNRAHSDPLVLDLAGNKNFTGLDVKLGDWVTNANASRAWEIVKINRLQESVATVVLQDTGRYNQFQDDVTGTGSGTLIDGDVVVFEVNNGIPAVANLPATVATTLALDWSSQIQARFAALRDKGELIYKPNHGYIVGQLLRVAKAADVPVAPIYDAPNGSPVLTAGDVFSFNDSVFTVPSTMGTSGAIGAYLTSLGFPGVTAANSSGFVRFTSTSGTPVYLSDVSGTSISVGLGIPPGVGLNTFQAGSFIPAISSDDTVAAQVTALGTDPHWYYAKVLGSALSTSTVVSGAGVGDVVYFDGTQFTATPPASVSQAFIVRHLTAPTTILGTVGATHTVGTIVLNKVIVAITGTTVASAVADINLGTAQHLVTASNVGGALQLVSTGNIVISDGYDVLFCQAHSLPVFTKNNPLNEVVLLSRGANVAQASGVTGLTKSEKILDFTAAVANDYWVNPGAPLTVTMPTTGLTGSSKIIVRSSSNTNYTNTITIDPGVIPVDGVIQQVVVRGPNVAIQFDYFDATVGWSVSGIR